ncbi:unnamed protein product, partial [Vitis vinifera]
MRGEKDKGKRVTAKMPFKTIYHMEKRIYLKPNKSPKNINITPTIYESRSGASAQSQIVSHATLSGWFEIDF